MTFDSRHGELIQFADFSNCHEFLTPQHRIALWHITFADGRELGTDSAKAFSWTGGADAPLKLKWSQFGLASAPKLQVTAQVTLDQHERLSNWRISVDGLRDSAVRTVAFPRIGFVTPQEHETLAVPQWIGEATSEARTIVNPAPGTAGRHDWDYPGELSMQFLAFYGGEGPGLLISADDAQLLRKQFSVFGDGSKGLGLEVIHYAPVTHAAESSYSPPYELSVRAFNGDWFTAAEHYRRWAQHQSWVKESCVRTHQTPDWVRNTALWVWNRGPSSDVLAPAVALQEYAALPVSVLWHWWHGCAYDVGFPEYFPPREGADKFRRAVAKANARGVHAIVYMNQRLWGMTTKSWKQQNASKWAVKRTDGTIGSEVYNTFTHAPCASMCMGTSFWRNTYATLAEKAVRDFGVAGIYMDQACSSLACYDQSHGHPLGGGAYWLEGFKKLQGDIRRRCADRKQVALAGEGCSEGWLPYLDIMLSLQVSLERYAAPDVWKPLPLFNVVYHDCSTQFGNYSSLTRPPYDSLWPKKYAPKEPLALLDQMFDTQFRLEQARSFVWGQQPTLANFRASQLQQRLEEIEYLLRIARLRQHALKYLRDGVFLRPPDLNVPQIGIPISRLSIYAGQQDAVQEYHKTVPAVLASVLRASDGDVALVLANITDKAVPLHISLKRPDYPLPTSGTLYRLTEDGLSQVAQFDRGAVERPITLDLLDVRIYEITSR